jgi:predicted SAM-dependent methyltransferase
MNLDAITLPRKANLGCGWDKREGFLNIDLHEWHKPDLVGDVTNLPELPSGHFTYLLAQDVLEHLERSKVPVALAEWARLLAPDGTIELRLPSVLHLMQLLAKPEYRPAEKATEILHLLFGTQAYTGDFHLSGFTPTLLVALMRDAGMLVCEAAIRDNWLFEVRVRKTAALTNPEEQVHQAYFEVLDRPADAGGLATFVAALNEGKITIQGVRDALRSSEEGNFIQTNPSYLVPFIGQPIGNQKSRLSAVVSNLKSRLRGS